MNRRRYLAALSSGGAVALSGCAGLFGHSDRDSNPSPTDSDHDGVPNRDDYAPWDGEVQNKSDLLDRQPTRRLTPADDDRPNSVSRLVTAGSPPVVSAVSVGDEHEFVMSGFTSRTDTRATVRVRAVDRPDDPHRVLVLLRGFPRGRVYDHRMTETLDPGDVDIDVTVPAPDTPTDVPMYLVAYFIPDGAAIADLSTDDIEYVHETNPFHLASNGRTSPADVHRLDELTTDHLNRTPVDGGYVVVLSGRTDGAPWEVGYFVSQAAYLAKRREPRGRNVEEYVTVAIREGVAETVTDILKEVANGAGLSNRRDQARLAVDFVQSFPYIKDNIGTGFDEYPKFAEETLAELRGDCEDSAIVLAMLLDDLGFDVVLVTLPRSNHLGVGVAGDFKGSYVTYRQTQYFYVETTGAGWAIGDIPDELDTSEIEVARV